MMTTLKTLVAVDADLASSIAIRYACQLANLTGMQLQIIHVVEPQDQGYSPGTGWVRRTWEDALLQTGGEEIAQLIQAERASCPALGIPQIAVGERDQEILKALQAAGCDLFMEGLLHSFTSTSFQNKIRSRLYRSIPCPVMLVKNLVTLEKGVLLVAEHEELQLCVSAFLKIFKRVPIEPELLICRFLQKEPARESELPQNAGESLRTAEKILNSSGRKATQSRVVQGTVETLDPYLRDFSLVIAAIAREKSRKDSLLEILGRTPSPVMLCWH
jgi:nucleotide-binding universal stress UspA family protein